MKRALVVITIISLLSCAKQEKAVAESAPESPTSLSVVARNVADARDGAPAEAAAAPQRMIARRGQLTLVVADVEGVTSKIDAIAARYGATLPARAAGAKVTSRAPP